jgi:hypothetical protein
MNENGTERTMVDVGDGAALCVEAIGNPAEPAVLLIGGATFR